MPYDITERAKSDMISLYVDGAHKHGLEAAERYYAGLITQFEALALNPLLYHERTETVPPIRVCPYGVHVVIYKVQEDGRVLIIRVRHGREDWSEA